MNRRNPFAAYLKKELSAHPWFFASLALVPAAAAAACAFIMHPDNWAEKLMQLSGAVIMILSAASLAALAALACEAFRLKKTGRISAETASKSFKAMTAAGTTAVFFFISGALLALLSGAP